MTKNELMSVAFSFNIMLTNGLDPLVAAFRISKLMDDYKATDEEQEEALEWLGIALKVTEGAPIPSQCFCGEND